MSAIRACEVCGAEFQGRSDRRFCGTKCAMRAWREANRERVAERKRACYIANRERVAEQHRVYYFANRERVAERVRAWQEANRARLRLGARARRRRKLREAAA